MVQFDYVFTEMGKQKLVIKIDKLCLQWHDF